MGHVDFKHSTAQLFCIYNSTQILSHTLSFTHTQNTHKSCGVFVASVYPIGCVRSTSERGRQGVWAWLGGFILFAFGTQTVQSMQIDKQWHLLCYFSCDIAVSYQSKQRVVCRGVCECVYACVCTSAHAPARCVHLFKSAKGPRPCSTNHMKALPLVRIALSKATLMLENGDERLWRKKEKPTGVSGLVKEEGEKSVPSDVWCFPEK